MFDIKHFRNDLLKYINDDINVLQSKDKNWVVKGFIDVYKNIYTISIDTKVISKILELMLFPTILRFSDKNKLSMEFAKHQNHYPDITFTHKKTNTRIALDIKSTYRVSETNVNGFTLGAFTGYFRKRDASKNITYPYNAYDYHLVLGIIYSKQEEFINENNVYSLSQINEILSVVKDFDFILQEKFKLANSRTGSGNTKNIGSITNIQRLKDGEGPFSKLGIEIFDDYWMYYLTKDMTSDKKVPYSNLVQYSEYKKMAPNPDDIIKVVEESPINLEE